MPQDDSFSMAEFQCRILQTVAASPDVGRLGNFGQPRSILQTHITKKFGESSEPSKDRFMEAVWSLVAQRLAYIDYSQGVPENWSLRLTDSGRAVASGEEASPDNPYKYLESFAQDIPDASDIVLQYVKEALATYTQQCFMACAVMLGVAAEAAFLDMADSFSVWLQEKERGNFKKMLDNPRTLYSKLFEGFRKRIEPKMKQLPRDLADNLDIQLNSILNLIRKYRNDAGHPTGVQMERGACFLSLVAFAEAAKHLFALKAHFDANAKPTATGNPQPEE